MDLTLLLDGRIGATLFVFLTFAALTYQAVESQGWSVWWASRTVPEWILDGLGLLVQGAVVPLLQAWLVIQGLRLLLPDAAGIFAVPAWAAFLLTFVLVDYLYYWNHRLLHTKTFWPMHKVHHASRVLDAWATSRNTLWTPLFIVYLWLNGILLYLTGQESAILWAAALSSALDLWRHSGRPLPGVWEEWVSWVLITPVEHAWHHASGVVDHNFGANFNLWDKLHGTYLEKQVLPERLGVDVPASLSRRLLWPFS